MNNPLNVIGNNHPKDGLFLVILNGQYQWVFLALKKNHKIFLQLFGFLKSFQYLCTESEQKEKTMTEKDTNNSSTSSVDKILSHQLFVVEKDPIKDKAWEKQQEKALQQQSPKVEVNEVVQESHKPRMAEVYSNDLQTLKIWFDSKQFTKELEESIRQLPKTLFSDDTIEYYIQERVKKEEEIMALALATV